MENITAIAWTLAPDIDKDYTKPWYSFLVIAYETVSVLMILSNILTIVVYVKTEQLQTPTNLLVCNQSIIDGLMSITGQPYLLLNYTQWGIKKAMQSKGVCLFGLCFVRLTNIGSLVGILVLSIERSVAIFCPFRYYTLVTDMTVRMVIILSWLFFSFFAILPLLGHNTWKEGMYCTALNVLARDHVYSAINVVFVCLVVVAILNISIAVLANKKNRVQDSMTAVRSGHFKVMKMLLKVVGVYYICRLPFLVTTFALMATPLNERAFLPVWFVILHDMNKTLIGINSLVNPLIYSHSNQEFRDAYKRIIGIN
ncbi:hypothetical protein CAPTEDRAFT_204514 [Capitella teleta]|uniref:G-protein coupled receptors family 1 profile domain-containing protein n=1 Tax=Capitella teleta TaxID=283909 RepID=R7TXD0_CAPTE|nr:hypothetical protein CAPTEDRAFT_204514 [Capitella teleta]|eukprot:ELT98359.1 hypothetical protein CAPTEDRAFT_204514 [Capitella teleta]